MNQHNESQSDWFFPYDTAESVSIYGETLKETAEIDRLCQAVQVSEVVHGSKILIESNAFYSKGIVTDYLVDLEEYR